MILTALVVYKIGFYLSFVLLGFAGGVITGVRIAPPTEDTEIQFGKIKWKVKGRKNTVEDGLEVTNIVDIAKQTTAKPTWKERRATRKVKRLEKKNK